MCRPTSGRRPRQRGVSAPRRATLSARVRTRACGWWSRRRRLRRAACQRTVRPDAGGRARGLRVRRRRRRATATVALVGDSHAAHWRAAIEVVAQSHGWHGVSMTHSSCPFSRRLREPSPCPPRRRAAHGRRRVLEWFEAPPGRENGLRRRALRAEAASFRAAAATSSRPRRGIRRRVGGRCPPRSGIVVLRDTPKSAPTPTLRPARQASHDVPAGPAPSRAPPPWTATRWWPPRRDGTRGASASSTSRGSSATATVLPGDRRRARRASDSHHLTRVFAATLGPLVLRRVG